MTDHQPHRLTRFQKTAGVQVAALLALGLFLPGRAHAQTTIEDYGGTSFSLPLPVSISQRGFPDIKFTGHFKTRPFVDAPYYQFRLGLWKGSRGWLIEFLHHKLYLDRTSDYPAEVQDFDITNGYSLITLSRGWRRHQTVLAAGAGIILAYPITKVRGRSDGFNEGFGGYHFAGPTIVGTLAQRFPISKRIFFAAETRTSFSYARIPINGGHASVPNVALHLHLGVGLVFP